MATASPRQAGSPWYARLVPWLIIGGVGVLVVGGLICTYLVRQWRALPAVTHPTTPDQYWGFIEAIAAVSASVLTLALVIITTVGLRAIALAKRDLLIRSKREARLCAIECCHDFAAKVIPANAPVLYVPEFPQKAGDAWFTGTDEAALLPAAKEWVGSLQPKMHGDIIRVLNLLEAWAMPFVHSVADPEVAYGPCSPLFLSTINRLYPKLIVARADPGSGSYPNIVRLFEAWFVTSTQAERDALKKKVADVMEEQRRAERRATAAGLNAPLGTDG